MRRILMKVWDVQGGSALLPSLLFLCVCFVIGAVTGSIAAANSGDSEQLASAASEYAALADLTFGVVLLKLLRYPAALFLSGLCVAGAVFIPIIVAVRGFFLSFAVTAFMRLFGVPGLLYSASLFGFQCLLVLPCLMLIAAQGLLSSSLLFSLAAGSGKKISGPIFGGPYFLRVLICFAVLLVCAAAETYLAPYLVSLVTNHLLH